MSDTGSANYGTNDTANDGTRRSCDDGTRACADCRAGDGSVVLCIRR
jgi:hypothetical protein